MQFENCTQLYSNNKGSVWQDNRGRGFWLDWEGRFSFFRYPTYVDFSRHVGSIDLEAMVMDTSAQGDFTIFSPRNSERLFVLSLCEAWHLKDLLSGAQTMLDLHRIVQERLYSFALV
ncbi:MAG TPA: hypothetical protein DCE41_35380 [Cytophagales bacterium]|nr:hypothetical protein [Cytophagales bacterium]HAA23461.1 hypothetical protein [Cytophagales bacterium]HAP60662.1 hypothetical protein [Cytophagales bacterium]